MPNLVGSHGLSRIRDFANQWRTRVIHWFALDELSEPPSPPRYPTWLDWVSAKQDARAWKRSLWTLSWPFRQLAKDCYEFPATMGLIIFWFFLYIIPVGFQAAALGWTSFAWGLGLSPDWLNWMGSVSPSVVWAGEWWRLITANSLHFNLVHFFLNVIGLYSLGRLVEDWYRSAQFLLLVVFMGSCGYLIACAIRMGLGQPHSTSVGGSTLVFSLIGLGAAVGLRERNRFGVLLRIQMIALLFVNFLIGYYVHVVDNIAHFSGALIGFFCGAFDQRLFQKADHIKPFGFVVMVMTACLMMTGSQGWQIHKQRQKQSYYQAEMQRRETIFLDLADMALMAQRHEFLAIKDPRLNLGADFDIFESRKQIGGFSILRIWLPLRRDQVREQVIRDLARLDQIAEHLGAPQAIEQTQKIKILLARSWFKRPNDQERREFFQAHQILNRMLTIKLQLPNL